ncbi:helix-turn-helix domain-containing protein [Haladaptatus halobius]|uniref:helix-turn-helix domain-containing protein n=1 Tax=Haladaptatus halobius TaxID=2884875 RepID=UPI001D0A55C7|nr:helix-turn-helix domain-containing protein [Haladaptatus halobius]
MTELQNTPAEVDDVQATKQHMVVIVYTQGNSQTDLAEWYGFSRKTVYFWLQRFEKSRFTTQFV